MSSTSLIARSLSPARLRGFGPGATLAGALLLGLRLLLGIVAAISVELWSVGPGGGAWAGLQLDSREPGGALLWVWQRWDALWYQQIAQHGYGAHDGTAAFSPLYPFLVQVVSVPLLGNVVLAELLVSSVAMFGAMALLYRLAERESTPETARLTVLLLAFAPAGFFLLAPYTESLFLLFALATLWFAREERFWAAGLAGFAAALTRAQGGLLVLPLAYAYWRRGNRSQRLGVDAIAVLLPLIGQLGVEAYVRLVAGETRSPLTLLRIWGYRAELPWQALGNSIFHIVTRGDGVELVNLACLMGAVVLAVVAARRLPFVYTLYSVPLLLFLLCREMWLSPLMSVARYTLVLFPCFLALAILLQRAPRVIPAALAASLGLQIALFIFWVHWTFVG